ncbi:tetratricopeptide repeat protein, partial [Candidatus Nitrosotalea sp. TS]|uniref:tetratricopeptide repeat protein n=1 Tax=Candidatus Nitrosotalea sp. TS TaxID=2341020 RepID=UPI00403E28EA
NVPNTKQPSSAVVDMTKQIIATTPENFGSDNASTINLKCQAFLTISYVDAYNYCYKALQLDPQNKDLQNNETDAYNSITSATSDIIRADNSLNKDPEDEVALATKASALFALGKYSDSLVYENQALQTNPSDTELVRNKAIMLFYIGRDADALQTIDNATLYPVDYPLKISILCSNGKYDEAILYVDEFYKQLGGGTQHSEDLDNFEKGLIYEKMGNQDTANDYYQLAMSDGGISADNLDIVKARMYYNLLMDFNKTSEYAEKIPSGSPYYREASDLNVIAGYYQSKSENQSLTEVGASIIQPTLTTNTAIPVPTNQTMQIPGWIKNNAKWWSEGVVNDNDFVQGVQYLIKQKIINIPPQTQTASSATQIPAWVKSTAGWWGNGQVSDDDFVKGIEYLVRIGIIKV